MKNQSGLSCDFLDNDDTMCVSLLRDHIRSYSFNHTDYLIARQLLLQRITDRAALTVDRLLRSDDCMKLVYPSGSLVAQCASYDSFLSSVKSS